MNQQKKKNRSKIVVIVMAFLLILFGIIYQRNMRILYYGLMAIKSSQDLSSNTNKLSLLSNVGQLKEMALGKLPFLPWEIILGNAPENALGMKNTQEAFTALESLLSVETRRSFAIYALCGASEYDVDRLFKKYEDDDSATRFIMISLAEHQSEKYREKIKEYYERMPDTPNNAYARRILGEYLDIGVLSRNITGAELPSPEIED